MFNFGIRRMHFGMSVPGTGGKGKRITMTPNLIPSTAIIGNAMVKTLDGPREPKDITPWLQAACLVVLIVAAVV